MNQQEADALRKIQNDVGAKVSTLRGQIAALAQAESTELANALRARQEQHLAAYLRQFSLQSASIPGVGSAFRARLFASGFHTAADVDFYAVQRVYGIGPVRANAIVDWRKSLEARARSTMPSALSQSEAAAIRAKYEGQRRALEDQRDREQRRQRDEEERIRAQYCPLLQRLNEEENDANAKTQAAISEIRARYARQYRAIRETLSKLSDDTASKLREADARIAEARKKLFSLHWEKEKLRRQLKPYEEIRFSKYLKRVFFGSQAA
ncbi:MAG: hypothetical protein K6U78_16465 [Anaerolineae bacterium]|nr:hypothetical protein [Anaerolineae bacterium]